MDRKFVTLNLFNVIIAFVLPYKNFVDTRPSNKLYSYK